MHVLAGHTSTIRCIRVLHARPIAVSGARDGTVRVWDVRRGRCVRVLQGHDESVRALDVFGNRAVSGSYDRTCRVRSSCPSFDYHGMLMRRDSCGTCTRASAYTAAFDGERIAPAGLDTTVRIWSASTGYACSSFLPAAMHAH